jgi:transcriptional regulator of NAD metabolism
MNYYTYLLINENNGMMYIGKRQCSCSPNDDTSYMGSSKYVPKEECDKIVLSCFDNHLDAVNEEIRLHNLYDVANNELFYNRSKQTSTKFDTTGFRFNLTEEQKKKISESSKGTPKTLTEEQREANRKRLAKYRTPEIRAKAANSLKKNGSNKGIKNPQFKPWYITTETQTYLFYDISKNEKSLKDGFKNKKHYTDLQRKLVKGTINHRIYGKIVKIGNIPKQ